MIHDLVTAFAGYAQIQRTVVKLEHAVRTSQRVMLIADDSRSTKLVMSLLAAIDARYDAVKISDNADIIVPHDYDLVIVGAAKLPHVIDGEAPSTCLYTPAGASYQVYIPLLYWREADKRIACEVMGI